MMSSMFAGVSSRGIAQFKRVTPALKVTFRQISILLTVWLDLIGFIFFLYFTLSAEL